MRNRPWVLLLTLPLLPALAHAQPAAPSVRFSNPRATRAAEACLERLATVPDETGPARVHRAESSRRRCELVRRHEPGAGADAVMGYLDAMIAWAQAGQAAAQAAEADHEALDQRLRNLPLQVRTNWSSPADNPRIEAEIAALRRRVATLAPEVRRSPPPTMASLLREFRSEAPSVQRDLARLDTLIQGGSVVDAIYNDGLALDYRWYAASQLFPEDGTIREAHARTQRWLARLGGRGGARDARQAATQAAAAARSFPSAASRDASLERSMRRVFEAQGWNEPVRALAITDAAWSEERNAAGALIARRRSAAVGVRLADGTCRMYDFVFIQPRHGGGWGPLRRSSHSSVAIACENLPR